MPAIKRIKIIVEINDPSAHEYINEKLKLMEEIFHRYRPGEKLTNIDLEDPTMIEFDYLVSHALYISAMRVPKDGKIYRYTDWEDIEKIITTSLSINDSGILLKIVGQARFNVSPVTFALPRFECPDCHHVETEIPINNIGSTLLFPLARRQANTTINLVETL